MRLYDKAGLGSEPSLEYAAWKSPVVESNDSSYQDVQAANELLHSGEAALKVALKAP